MSACFPSKISFIKKIYRFFFRLYLEKKRKLNPVKTLWFNIRFLPWRQARHLPFFIHGPLTVAREGGLLLLDIPDSELKPGLIRLGYDFDRFSTNYAGTLLQMSGTIRWKGPFRCSVNTVIGACRPGASLEFGRYVSIGARTSIRAYRSITVEDNVSIVHDGCVYDTDFHPFRNILTGEIHQYTYPVKIGYGSFISSGAYLAKGTVLPPYSLVASHSLLNRDYSSENVTAPFIAGVPGKIKSQGIVRLFEKDLEITVSEHFLKTDLPLTVHKGLPSDHTGRYGSFI